MKQRTWTSGLGAVLVVGGAAIALARAWTAFATSPLARELPKSATDLQEQSIDSSEGRQGALDSFPDHAYCLRARVDPADLPAYAARIGLTPHTPTRRYSDDTLWLSWPGVCTAPWWDPTDDLTTTWVAQSGRVWTYAKHEGGWIYVKSVGH